MTINDELMIDIKHLWGNRWSVKREDLDTYSRQIRRAISAQGRGADFQGRKRGPPSTSGES